MKNMCKLSSVLLLAAMLSACALPHSEIKSGTQRPSLAIIGAPTGSTLRVDGMAMGDASQYDGRRQVLTIEEGLHVVVIELNGTVLRTQKVYAAGGETSKVEVGGESR